MELTGGRLGDSENSNGKCETGCKEKMGQKPQLMEFQLRDGRINYKQLMDEFKKYKL